MTSKLASQPDSARGQILRFLLLGGINTLGTYALFIGLGLLIPAWIAYTFAYMAGLAWTTLGSSRFVFRAQFSKRRVLLFAAWYLLMFGIGQFVIYLISPHGFVELAITSLVVLAITTPLIFIGGRYIFVHRAAKPEPKKSGELPVE